MVNQQKPTKPKVTTEEKKFRKDLFPDVKEVKNKNLLCTSCGRSVKELIGKGKPISHPFMETLLCEKCNTFYGDGQFSEDEDGCDKYCRWCGQGGTLFLCSSCTAGFCKKCVKRNLPRSALQEIENDDWVCYCCNATPVFELRAQCWAAQQYALEHIKVKQSSSSSSSKSKSLKKKRTRDDSNSDDEDKPSSKKKKTVDPKKDDDDEDKSSRKSRDKSRRDESRKRSERNKSENGDEDVNVRRTSLRERKPQKVKKEMIDELSDGVKKSKWEFMRQSCLTMTSDFFKTSKFLNKKMVEIHSKQFLSPKYLTTFQALSEVRKNINEVFMKLCNTTNELKDQFNSDCEKWIKEVEAEKIQETSVEPAEAKDVSKEAVENGIPDPSESTKMDVDESSEPNKDMELGDVESKPKSDEACEESAKASKEVVEEASTVEDDSSSNKKEEVDLSGVKEKEAAESLSNSAVKQNGGDGSEEAKESEETLREGSDPAGSPEKTGDAAEKAGEEVKKAGDEVKKAGDEVKKAGEEVKKAGDEVKKGGDEAEKASSGEEAPKPTEGTPVESASPSKQPSQSTPEKTQSS